MARQVRRIVRLQVGSAAKVGGTLGVVVGLVGGLGWAGWLAFNGAAAGESPLLILAMPILCAGVAGLDAMILAALCAFTFNVTAWLTGGLALEDEEGPAPDA